MVKRSLLVGGVAALSSFLVFACGGGGGVQPSADAGTDADVIIDIDPVIKVSGTASLYPEAVAWMNQKGLPLPSLNGLTLRIEEPLKVALGDESGVFGTVMLDDSGAFSVQQVDTALVNLGVAAGIMDDSDAGTVVRSATALFDVQVQEDKPKTDIVGAKAYALPKAFHDALTEAVSPATVAQLSDGNFATLIGAGFILGKVVDAQGNPVGGVKLVTGSNGHDARFFYPSNDLTSVDQSGTHSNGLFVYVHGGGPTTPFNITVEGRPEYKKRNGGAAAGSALILTVYPGTTAP